MFLYIYIFLYTYVCYIYGYKTELLCCIPETNTLISYTLIFFFKGVPGVQQALDKCMLSG